MELPNGNNFEGNLGISRISENQLYLLGNKNISLICLFMVLLFFLDNLLNLPSIDNVNYNTTRKQGKSGLNDYDEMF